MTKNLEKIVKEGFKKMGVKLEDKYFGSGQHFPLQPGPNYLVGIEDQGSV